MHTWWKLGWWLFFIDGCKRKIRTTAWELREYHGLLFLFRDVEYGLSNGLSWWIIGNKDFSVESSAEIRSHKSTDKNSDTWCKFHSATVEFVIILKSSFARGTESHFSFKFNSRKPWLLANRQLAIYNISSAQCYKVVNCNFIPAIFKRLLC